MKISIPHKFSQSEAVARVQQALQQSRAQLASHAADIKEEWQGNTLNFGFTAQGQRIEGALVIEDKSYELTAKLPLALRLFEGRIEKMIRDEVAKLV